MAIVERIVDPPYDSPWEETHLRLTPRETGVLCGLLLYGLVWHESGMTGEICEGLYEKITDQFGGHDYDYIRDVEEIVNEEASWCADPRDEKEDI